MENAIGKLRVNDLDGKIFIIPYYQRGYRWTENEAEKLFADLCEFAESDEKEYCLQPVVLQKVEKQNGWENGWENFPDSNSKEILRVVDGQQRLTTIAILMNVLKIEKNWDIYYIAERNTLSALLLCEQTLGKDAEETINDYFRKVVKNAFSNKSKEEKDKVKELFNKKSVSFLRYDIQNVQNDREGHSAFLRLNAGKTPLTSSELIRALYMVNASGISEHERMEIAKEWEIIENTLRDEQFWLMFNSKGLSNTPTRIDLLFALVMDVSLENAKANPRIVFETMDKQLDLKAIWQDVLRCFWWMQSCYADVELFNYLCWINVFTENSAKTIYGYWRKYPKPEDFKKSIIAIIQKKYTGRDLKDFNYDCDKTELRALFVLLNLLDCNHSKERFRFDLYQEDDWDIEHIDSQTPNELKDELSKKWLLSSYKELSKKEEEFKKQFPNFDEEKISYGALEQFPEMASVLNKLWYGDQTPVDEVSDKNAIGNLALLNTSINRYYKNAIFPAKRKVIKEFIVSGKCYVPPCTAKAFMKFYTESPSKITYWLENDFEGYSRQMQTYYDDIMNIDSDLKSTDMKAEHKDYSQSKKDHSNNNLENRNTSEHPERSSAVTFMGFMNRYDVVIPKIQRLYVQGRLDSHGKKCLSSFAAHLVDCVVNKKCCNLDFIYGIDNKKVFYPLDGQQRLTTLLLLAWLCGVKEAKDKWSFRYESRRATEMFIDGLLKSQPPELSKPTDYDERKKSLKKVDYLPLCSEYLENSGWFLPAWKEDPGIAGMLEMLDSLYGKLLDSEKTQFDPEKTQSGFSKIKFFVNYLDASRAAYDQIFLKMNSRGKPLTEWENLKAVLDKNAPGKDRVTWQENLNNTWQELLWEKLNEEQDNDRRISTLDAKMLSVIKLALGCVGYEEKNSNNTFQLTQWLENKGNKTNKEKFYELCTTFFSALNDEKKDCLGKALTPAWEEDVQWPDFKKDDSEHFYKPLLAYYAANQSTNDDWMRVVWNIVENAGITKNEFPKAYILINELSQQKNDILEFLAEDTNEIKSQFAKEQVNEERAKAKQIVDPPKDCQWNCYGPNRWEIQYAEKFAFFKGAIRFLYTDEDGNKNWVQFRKKFENVKKYFSEKGLEDNKVLFIRAFLSQCTDWDQQIYNKQIFNTGNAANCKKLLLAQAYICPIHKCLIADSLQDLCEQLTNVSDENMKNIVSLLVKKENFNFIKEIIEKYPEFRFRWNYNHLALYAPYGRDVITFDWGNSKRIEYLTCLSEKSKISIQNKKVVDNVNLFWGWNIDFSYNEHSFQYSTDGNIYLMEDKNRVSRSGETEQKKFYCFKVEQNSTNNIIDPLEALLSEYEKQKSASRTSLDNPAKATQTE